MAEPKDYNEYLERFHGNYVVTGFGSDTKVIMPCPFCSAPAIMSYKIIDAKEEMKKERTCVECKRSFKCIFHVDTPLSTEWEMVQTSGPDQPEWLNIKLRRV